jgi:hypothetical protein
MHGPRLSLLSTSTYSTLSCSLLSPPLSPPGSVEFPPWAFPSSTFLMLSPAIFCGGCKWWKKGLIFLQFQAFRLDTQISRIASVLPSSLNKFFINFKILNCHSIFYHLTAMKDQKLFSLTFKFVYLSKNTHLPNRNMNFAKHMNSLFFLPMKCASLINSL